MRIILTIAITLCFASSASAATAQKGAKAMFVDSTSGATIESAPAERTRSNAKPPARKRTSAQEPSNVAEVSGLMYYVELISANGETSRVTTDRVFRSGERILLHVISSIDGEIAVYQRTPEGRAARLFPDDRIGNGSAQIVKGVDTILPSPTSWFRFDNQSGIEELTIVLTPRSAPSQPTQIASQATTPARYDDIASASGSKGLVVETENVGASQATYVVRRTENGAPPKPIVVAIRLEHR